MEPIPRLSVRHAGLPLILIAAVIQGWSLYGLHHAIQAHQWPATNLAWLIALYAIAFLVPATVQLTAEYAAKRSFWVLTAVLAALIFYFGWHHGGAVAGAEARNFAERGEYFPLVIVLLVWWLLALPFIQSRVATGRWAVDYARLFAFAWRNKITLAEAALFSGLFWLILFLWLSLFHMLGIDFFQTLFEKPIFVYPVTAIVFGCALHLIGSIDAMISTVLEQLLNVLKWLATVAVGLLILFTVALVAKLSGLFVSGHPAIGAEWLLWLVAVIVLLLNAAYRDGTVAHPYPRWIAQTCRFAVPLTIVISQTALYALIVRSHEYGLTVERVWAFIVAGATVIYSIGYSIAAFRRGSWLARASTVNVIVAVALIVLIGAALTPLMSPYRLAASSQYHRILDGRYAEAQKRYGESPFVYLAFESGEYGRKALQRLAALQGRPGADEIRHLASRALEQKYAWQPVPPPDATTLLAQLPVYPTGHPLDARLVKRVVADWGNIYPPGIMMPGTPSKAAGIFIDLDGDGTEEFVLLSAAGGPVYQDRGGSWERIGRLSPEGTLPAWSTLAKALASGSITTVAPAWKDLSVGTDRYRMLVEPTDFRVSVPR